MSKKTLLGVFLGIVFLFCLTPGVYPSTVSSATDTREEISLNGVWDFMKVDGDLSYPPSGVWEN